MGTLLTLWLVALVGGLVWVWRRARYWIGLGLPEVPALPLVGNLLPLFLKRTAYFQLIEGIYQAGRGLPYIGCYNFWTPILLVRDPALLQAMIRDDAKNFEDHGLKADPSDPLSLNLLYINGTEWKMIRNQLRPNFSHTGMKNIFVDVQQCVDDILMNFYGKIDIRKATDELTCGILAKTVFCIDSTEGLVDNANKVFDMSGLGGLRAVLRTFVPTVAIKLGIKIVPQSIEDFFRNALRCSKRKPGSFLDSLCQLKEKYSRFTDDHILGQFFIFVLAGFETTSTALSFCLYLLAKHPEIQEKAREEVKQVTREYGVSHEAQKAMVYLEWIINETLRLYSPVTSILRVCGRGYRLPCGVQLPPGTGVLIPYLAIHRDPDIYRSPTEFIPERWDNGFKPDFFYPFGFGPRNCLGMTFALLEIRTFLSSFLLKYEAKLDPDHVEPLEFDTNSFFIVPKNPLYIMVEPLPENNQL